MDKRKVYVIFMIIFAVILSALTFQVAFAAFEFNGFENSKIDAPNLVSLNYYQNKNGDYFAKLTWDSKKDSTYQILRKTKDKFEVISNVTSDGGKMTFYDKISAGKSYCYSVREVKEDFLGKLVLGPYDKAGLTLIDCPNFSVDFKNLNATIKWDKVEYANVYKIFKKMHPEDKYQLIAIVNANTTSFTDVYRNSNNNFLKILNGKTFADPSYNSFIYTVRGCKLYKKLKVSNGLYLKDGDFKLESPAIVSLRNNTIKWGSVPNAEGYLILKKDKGDGEWKSIGKCEGKSDVTLSLDLDNVDNNSYYSVQAYSTKNGKTVYSDYDKNFSLINYSKDNSKYKILYFGDSITYGSPYKDINTRHIFSIPYRVGELLGCTYYNPSIPGSTYHDLGQNILTGKNILNSNYYRYRICREVVDPISNGQYPANWEELDTAKNSEGKTNTSIEDYNIVVLAAGTNDYADCSELGPLNSSDTKTFNGAFNHILDKIEVASKNRINKGESPIKVVFVDLYFSSRSYNQSEIIDRDLTPNKINLTLTDYQKDLDQQYDRWQNKSEYLEFYHFNTRDYDIVNETNFPYTASDNLHFTKFTYGQYGNVFAQFLVENVFE